jgi:hypothetical protein
MPDAFSLDGDNMGFYGGGHRRTATSKENDSAAVLEMAQEKRSVESMDLVIF